MHPILLSFPSLGVTITSYNACLVLATLVPFAIGPRWVAALEGLDRRRVVYAMLLVGIAAFVGARAHFVVNQWEEFENQPVAAFKLWSGGLHAAGAIVLLVLTAPAILHWLRVPLARFADGFMPTVGIGIAIARLGCFLHGCCFGAQCSWLWCPTFPQETYIYQYHADLGVLPSGAERTLPIHPLQLYFAASALLITITSIWRHHRKRYDGEVALVGLLLFSVTSTVLEFFRADAMPRAYWGSYPQLAWTAFAMSVVALTAIARAELAYRRGNLATAAF